MDDLSESARGEALTISAAARRLGVAAPTLRSWERRYGLGPSAHSAGGHRRYSSSDMDRLGAFCRLVGAGVATAEAAASVLASPPEPDEAASARPGKGPTTRTGGGQTLPVGQSGGAEARGLARCAVRMDTQQMLSVIQTAIDRDGAAGAWQQVIEPALRAVGRKWTETSGRYVEVEHLLSWCVAAVLHRVDPPGAANAPAARGVMLACAPGEWHSLPLEVLRASLVELDLPVCMLGPAVPADALRAAITRLAPFGVVVWSQTSATANPADLPRPADPAHCRVWPAGPGWSGNLLLRSRVLSTLTSAIEAVTAR